MPVPRRIRVYETLPIAHVEPALFLCDIWEACFLHVLRK